MKVSISMFQNDKEEVQLPQPLFNLSEQIVQSIVVYMRLFAIKSTQLDITYAGVVPVSNIKFNSDDETQLPEEFKIIRTDIIKGVIKTLMERFAIGKIDIALTDEEKTEIQQTWETLKSGGKVTLNSEGYEVKANIPSEVLEPEVV